MEEEVNPPAKKFSWSSFLIERKWILLILIPLIVALLVRLEPMQLKPIEDSATQNVYNAYKAQFRTQINSQFPNLPDAEKNKLADKKLQEYLQTTEGDLVRQQVKEAAENFKAQFQYESGSAKYPYLGDIDSYYWLRMSRNIVEKGTQCDKLQDGICYDTYTAAPVPREKIFDMYPVLIVWNYRVLKLFNPNMSLMQASFLTPLILSLLFTIPLFLLLRKLAGNIAAIAGTVLVNVNPYVLSRSLGSDSDILNVFFQAIFLWLAVECFAANSTRKKWIWSALCGTSIAIYSMFWTGWWYLLDLFIASLALGVGYQLLREWFQNKSLPIASIKKYSKESIITIGIFVAPVIIIYGLLYSSLADLWAVLAGQLGVFKFKTAANSNLWPNVLTTVAEFGGIGVADALSTFGQFIGISLFLMALLGGVFLIFHNTSFIKKNFLAFAFLVALSVFLFYSIRSSGNPKSIFFLLLILPPGIYLHMKSAEDKGFRPGILFILVLLICLVTYFSVTGARFLFLMAIPVSVLAAIFLARIVNLIWMLINGVVKLPIWAKQLFIALILAWFLVTPVRSGFETAKNYLPMVNDGWVESLEKIKQESQPDAIINSWWDFGHWFKYFADRGVTLDGSSQNSPQLHWLGKLLVTSDENASRGILRMLDCGGNKAFAEINKKINDTPTSIDILNDIITKRKKEATQILRKNGFDQDAAVRVLEYTHCSPPENYLITSQDMIGKGGVWAHFGSWDFEKAYMDSLVTSRRPDAEIVSTFTSRYGLSEAKAKSWLFERKSKSDDGDINAWIAPWPSYLSGFTPCATQNRTVCVFSQGSTTIPIAVNFEKKEAYVGSPGQYPQAVAFADEGSFELVTHPESSINIGAVIVKNGDSYGALFMSPELAGSMFTRLFFFGGIGLDNFEKFHDTTTFYGERIIVWKVKWDEAD